MRNSNAFLTITLFVFLTIPCGISIAAIDKFSPYAYTKVLYDSNIFKMSGDEEAIARLGDNNRDDTIGYLGAGFDSDLKLSRQHLLLQAQVERAKYDTFDDLDHTNVQGIATWAWQVGNLWSGNLGYDYVRRLRSFNQDQTPEKDMKTGKKGFLDAGYQIHPDLRLIAGITLSDVSFQERDNLDRDANSGRFEFQYRNTRNTRVGLRAEYTANDLNDQDVAGISISNDYKETEISGLFYWEGSAKSNLEARFGYTTQSYDDLDDRDYNGTTGSLTFQWLVTGKTTIDFSTWRETSTLFDEVTTYVLSQGVSIQPSWSVTPVITVSAEGSYENDDFKGENDIRTALGGQRRDDDTWRGRISARWDPRDYLSLSIGYERTDRDSSIELNDFDDKKADARVQVNF